MFGTLRKLFRFIVFLVLVAAALAVFFHFKFEPAKDPAWGLNFSIPAARYLDQDWKQVYLATLEELKPTHLRLMAYWELVEPESGKFDFRDMDFMLEEAAKRNINVIMVLGHKQPRWPECHAPAWAQNENLNLKNQRLLDYVKAVVMRYRDNQAVYAWQVENEPFFPYGPDCPTVSRKFYLRELALVRSLDERPIIVTDSGEKGDWLRAAWAGGDIFGSTMYREAYHDKKQRYIKYPIPPALYRIKAGMVKTFFGIDRFIGVELQAEPWFASDVHQTSWSRQQELMNPEIFRANIDYARRAGFAENYLWGVEWWYWAKTQGHAEMWEAAKELMQ